MKLTNQLILASAGTGKTFRLTGHFLDCLFNGAAPESILATTFTRKAAGEILGRVLGRLAAAAESDSGADRLASELDRPVSKASAAQILESMCRKLHRLRICTLDSFYQQLARSLSFELGLPPGWGILEDYEHEEYKQFAIDAVLGRQAVRDAERLLMMMAKGESPRSVRQLIRDCVDDFHDLYQLADSQAWAAAPTGRRLQDDELERLLVWLEEVELPKGKNWSNAREADLERARSGAWSAFIGTGIAGRISSGNPTYYNKPVPDPVIEIYEPLIGHAHAVVSAEVLHQTRATGELIGRYDREYQSLQDQTGRLRFQDITGRLARGRSEAESRRIRHRLDGMINHLLLDEFQDTSGDQWSVLSPLASHVAGLSATDEDASFFCVGDKKQAIYGWRGGEAGILDLVGDTVPDVRKTPLDRSYRSSQPVIDLVNQICQRLDRHPNLKEKASTIRSWVSDFPEHSTARDDLPGYGVVRTAPDFAALARESADDSVDARHLRTIWVAQQIGVLHQQTPAAHIGVLARSNSVVSETVAVLRRMGVDASEEGGTPGTDSPAALALLALFHIAEHPGCGVSRLHVACSPLGELVGITDPSDDDAAMQTAARFRRRLMTEGYGPVVRELATAVDPHCSSRDRLRLRQIVAEAYRWPADRVLSPGDFAAGLEHRKLKTSAVAPVRVMTVHQSKGLEFDVVVLADLEGDLFRTPGAAVYRPKLTEPARQVCIWRSESLRPSLPENCQRAFRETIDKQLRESLCILYVAMTRARHALHILLDPAVGRTLRASAAGLVGASCDEALYRLPETTCCEVGDANWYKSMPALTLAGRTVENSETVNAIHTPVMPGGRTRSRSRRAPSDHDDDRLFLNADSNGYLIGLRDATTPPAGRRKNGVKPVSSVSPTLRGTVMHAWLESLEWITEENWDPSAERIPEYATVAEQAASDAGEGCTPQDVSAMASQLDDWLNESLLQTVLTESRFREWLQSRVVWGDELNECTTIVLNERPFVMKGDELVTGIFDRLVLFANDNNLRAAAIIDYKTDRIAGDRDRVLQERAAGYAGQLATYREAVTYCFGVPSNRIFSGLAFLEANELVPVG